MAADGFDVAVVGGGLVGVATAWGLAREGCRVVVLDEGDSAVRASRGNFALVWVQSKGLGLAPYAGWTIRSSNAWAGFAEALKEETFQLIRTYLEERRKEIAVRDLDAATSILVTTVEALTHEFVINKPDALDGDRDRFVDEVTRLVAGYLTPGRRS